MYSTRRVCAFQAQAITLVVHVCCQVLWQWHYWCAWILTHVWCVSIASGVGMSWQLRSRLRLCLCSDYFGCIAYECAVETKPWQCVVGLSLSSTRRVYITIVVHECVCACVWTQEGWEYKLLWHDLWWHASMMSWVGVLIESWQCEKGRCCCAYKVLQASKYRECYRSISYLKYGQSAKSMH